MICSPGYGSASLYSTVHSTLMPVVRNQGILLSDNFLQSPAPCWHFIGSQQAKLELIIYIGRDKKIRFLHLESFIELYPISQCLFDRQIQAVEIPLISNNDNTRCLSYSNRSSSLLIQGNTHSADFMLGPPQYLQHPCCPRSTCLRIHTQCLWLW